MNRVTLGLCLCLFAGCGSAMSTEKDAGVDAGQLLPSTISASDQLTGNISAPKPTVGFDATGMTSTFSMRQTGAGAFKADVVFDFGGAPTVQTYTSASPGFKCNVVITSGTASADTWVALYGQGAQPNKGTCSLTFSSVEMSGGYVVHGQFAVITDAQGGASAGNVNVAGTF